MRVLFCSVGGAGHWRPLLPLASALLGRGHGVAWATAPDALPDLTLAGLERFAAGPSMPAARQAYRARWPEALVLRGEALASHTFPRLFGAVIAPAMLADLAAVVDRWQPDLVINEVAALAAPLVCVQRQIRHVTHGFGLLPPATHLAAAMQGFGAAWQAAGLSAPGDAALFRHLYIDIAPPSLQKAAAGAAVRTQALSPAGMRRGPGQALPVPLQRLLDGARRARVYLSFGTVFNNSGALAAAVQALATLDVQAVVTVGQDGDVGRLGRLPSNVHVERYVDQAALLASCDAVVSHAGAGTLLGAAAQGLPQLLLPQAADHFRNARALAAVGAGRLIEPEQLTAGAVAQGLQQVLASASIRAAAQRLAAEIAAMPTAEDVSACLERPL